MPSLRRRDFRVMTKINESKHNLTMSVRSYSDLHNLGELIRGTIVEILNQLLHTEPDNHCNAPHYLRFDLRCDTRNL